MHAHALDFEVNDTKVNVFGYAKLNLIYEFKDDLGNAVDKSKIRLKSENDSNGHFTAHAYESRLNFSTTTPTASGNFGGRMADHSD